MSNLPTIAQNKKVSTQGRNLQTWLDRGTLFSNSEEENCTDTTEYVLPTRTEDPDESNWPTWPIFYNHQIKLELIPTKDLITRVDRDDTIKSMLLDSRLQERADWWFDDDNQILYLKDDYFLITWKLTNVKQFEENIKTVVRSSRNA